MIHKLSLQGYKSVQKIDLELKPLNILIGPNGAGKSNLIHFFQLLDSLVQERLELFVGNAGGAERLLHFGSKTTDAIHAVLEIDQLGYKLELKPNANNTLIFQEEAVWVPGKLAPGQIPTLELSIGKPGRWVSLGAGQPESKFESMHSPLAPLHNEVTKIQQTLFWSRPYHFHDTSKEAKLRKPGYIYNNEWLKPDASNLAAFLYKLSTEHPKHHQMILKTIQRVAPFIQELVYRVILGQTDQILFEWREKSSQDLFDINYLSDGTIRFICLATLLLQPEPPVLILIDEPELGLHPSAIYLLAEMLKQAAKRTQVIVATQSPALLNQAEPEDIVVVENQQGQSKLKRLNTAELKDWLEDYTLGELWEKNVFGGKP